MSPKQSYSSLQLRLLALKWAVKKEDKLRGAEFTVFTDNNPLVLLELLGAVEQ